MRYKPLWSQPFFAGTLGMEKKLVAYQKLRKFHFKAPIDIECVQSKSPPKQKQNTDVHRTVILNFAITVSESIRWNKFGGKSVKKHWSKS